MFQPLQRLVSSQGIIGQFLRYAVVGGVAFVADYGTLLLLAECLHWHYLASATVAFVVGLVVNYALSVWWVFSQARFENKKLEFAIFAVIGVVGLLINNEAMWGFTDGLGIDYRLSKLLAAAIVLVWNFMARRIILFTK
ncbi:MAG: GtrA family protein [Muribaculaceae bacterium]|nr:GtrA family protein [Muribaculaceae bacterium]